MPNHDEQTRIEAQQCGQANATPCGFPSNNVEALARRPAAREWIMVGQAKRRLERPAGQKCNVGEIGHAPSEARDMSFLSTKRNAVLGVCCS